MLAVQGGNQSNVPNARSHVAVVLQEDYQLVFGERHDQQQEYDVRQYMFSTGATSSEGHFTVAVREQDGDSYQHGDMWRYHDSASPAVWMTLDDLFHEYAKDVYAVLMVAKVQPPDDMRPLLKAAPAAR